MITIRTFVFFSVVGSSLLACTPTQGLDSIFFPYDVVDTKQDAWPRLVDVQPIETQAGDSLESITLERAEVLSVGQQLQQNATTVQQPIIDPESRAFIARALSKADRNK